ncbi:MAG: DUF1028 domain-containing protein [Betaproteobacteria bacterium]|nr:DUF1028 domain-containing protein [Betaproteobacteria bacterium]
MNFAIIARSARTGQLGLAVASEMLAVGRFCAAAVRPNVGATFTQGAPLARNNRLALNLLAQGWGPKHVLHELAGNDADFEQRQIGIIDREGSVAVHSGVKLRAWSGHLAAQSCAVFGEGLAGEPALEAMLRRFEAHSPEDLDERLLLALEAARDAGAPGAGAAISAALVVWGRRNHNDIDLRVDLHERPIDELRRVYADYKPTAEFYDERARNPRNAISAKEFAENLEKRRAAEAS